MLCREVRGADWSPLQSVWELQKYMASLMSLNWNGIVEALLLEPTGEELRTSPPEEEVTHLGEELELLEAPEAAASLQKHLNTPKPKESTKWINTLNAPVPSSPTPKPCATLPRKQRNPSYAIQDVQMVRPEEMVALAWALQRCAICSGTPPGMLCGAVQELCRCLAPLLQRGNLLDLTMLDVAEKNLVTPPIPT